MIKVTLEFATVEEAQAALSKLTAVSPKAATPAIPVALPPVAEAPAKPVKAKPAPTPAAVSAVSAVAALIDAPAKQAANTPGTRDLPPPDELDTARAALRELFNAKGAPTILELLQREPFCATSISGVKPEHYAKFIKACRDGLQA